MSASAARRPPRADTRQGDKGRTSLARMSKGRPTSAGRKKAAAGTDAPTRRRRPREETRELLLQEAEDLLLARIAEGSETLNPLAALRITDVLSSINDRYPDQARMTTGAAYQIWESQTAFQDELLDRIMRKVAVPWESRARQRLTAAMESGLPVADVIAAMEDVELPPTEAGELSLALGLSAFVAPKRVRRAEKKANADFVRALGAIVEEILAYDRRRMRSGLTVADIVWTIEAFSAGAFLRHRTHPELIGRVDNNGHSLGTLVQVAIIEAMTEPIPAAGRAKSRRRSKST